MKWRNDILLLVVRTSVPASIASIGMLFASVWLLTPIGLGLLLYELWNTTKTGWGAFFRGYVFGIATSGAGIAWFWDTIPLSWLSIDVSVQPYAVGLLWLMASASMAIGTGVVATIIFSVRKNRFIVIITAFLLVLEGQLRMWGFSLITYGSQSLLGAHFSIASLGYSLAENNYLLQFARAGGVSALDFLIATLSASGALLIQGLMTRTKHKIVIGTSYLTIALLLPFPFSWYHLPNGEHTTSVAILGQSEKIEDTYHIDRVRPILEEFAASTTTRPDIIVLPEGFSVRDAYPTEDDRAALATLFGEKDILIVNANYVSSREINHEMEKNVTISYDATKSGHLASYAKTFFMPIGEYQPYATSFMLSLAHNESIDRFITRTSSLTRGEKPSTFSWHGTTIGGVLCSEGISPLLFHTLAKDGANVLIELFNPSWFHGSRILAERMLEIGKVHAVQERLYYIQAANDSSSFVMNPNGFAVAYTKGDETETLWVNLSTNSN